MSEMPSSSSNDIRKGAACFLMLGLMLNNSFHTSLRLSSILVRFSSLILWCIACEDPPSPGSNRAMSNEISSEHGCH
jgi:hypothetical protein